MISLTFFNENNPFNPENAPIYDVLHFYKIAFNTENGGKLKYGQGHYDFNDGSMLFIAPNQLVGSSKSEYNSERQGYILLIHPDFLLGYPLAKKIKEYGYFSYSVNEALYLSDSEKEVILSVYHIIKQEIDSRVGDFSQDVIIAQIELLLTYANRFYKRQFVTRKVVNNDVLQKTEMILDKYFNRQETVKKGLPTVQFLSEELHLSPGYLSDVLRSLIGVNAQQYIHLKLIEKAKEKLSTTNLSISEIAYELGFEHSQSFSKLFKSKTNISPLAFRQSFS
ncbi:helix-turn-helix transcriptional regulator [Salinimicrobium sp. TIG7-5_MAKvit]|uniref:helix-turn-helix domain-containing protein n=1 Tax=Salinimicrobium sp. TIG7-5_MAKvit TaxID=3121289 RepID=UPI003C6E9E95